jgi:predicted component of type VI protein secretion system
MAFIAYFYKDEEQGRMPLEGPVQIGRSPECEVAVRDILLSRHHCRIEPGNGGWVITDLGSKNGTTIGGTAVNRQNLQDGDVIRVGKTTVRFFAGEFVPAKSKPKTSPVARPADPFEALSGTISDFEFQPRGPVRKTDKLPTPRPGPQEPASYKAENVRGLVTEMVSSSWDSIYEEATRNEAEAPQSPLIDAVRKRRANNPHVDLALQVHPKEREGKLSPEKSGPRPGVIEAPKRVGPIRSLFRKLGMLFQVAALVAFCRIIG